MKRALLEILTEDATDRTLKDLGWVDGWGLEFLFLVRLQEEAEQSN